MSELRIEFNEKEIFFLKTHIGLLEYNLIKLKLAYVSIDKIFSKLDNDIAIAQKIKMKLVPFHFIDFEKSELSVLKDIFKNLPDIYNSYFLTYDKNTNENYSWLIKSNFELQRLIEFKQILELMTKFNFTNTEYEAKHLDKIVTLIEQLKRCESFILLGSKDSYYKIYFILNNTETLLFDFKFPINLRLLDGFEKNTTKNLILRVENNSLGFAYLESKKEVIKHLKNCSPDIYPSGIYRFLMYLLE